MRQSWKDPRISAIYDREAPPEVEESLRSAQLASELRSLRKLSELSYDRLDFRAGEILDERASLFAEPKGVFSTVEERDRAKALATEIGSSIYKNAPLGFGGQSLSVIFPTTVPNNSLPLLHSRGKGATPHWRPLFERLVN